MRRQLDLRVEDFVDADACIRDPRICSMIGESWKDGIMEEIRARSLRVHGGECPPDRNHSLSKEWDVEGIRMTLSLSRAEKE